ncbi:MAG: glycosyltransferase family 4 protein [Anaerolineales bacterium]
MRVLIVLTYFQPHKSGLTVYAVRQARALAARGHQVTVLTSQYDRSLAKEEWDEGVQILRLPVAFHLSKGVIMPSIPKMAWSLIGEADVVNLHVPQVDAALVGLFCKLRKKPLILTYHCDLEMPNGLINQLAGKIASLANFVAAVLADKIVHNTRDFAEHSAFLKRFMDKLVVIQPPIVVKSVSDEDIHNFSEKYDFKPGQKVIGMVARLATEKGVEYLAQAMPIVLQSMPEARAVFLGDYQHVFGEQAYKQRLMPLFKDLGSKWRFLGVLSEHEKATFYHLCKVLVLPSINSTESFGMVQVEAMSCGTPVVATDLPGVRQPILSTGMGKIVPIQDSEALAKAIIVVLGSKDLVNPEKVVDLVKHYSPESVAQAYEALYQQLLMKNG